MVNKAVRTALERLWKDRCSIFIREEVTDPVTHLTDSEEKPLLQDQPCKLSFETLTSTNGDEVATAQQVVKLFLSPDVKVPAGCKIIVFKLFFKRFKHYIEFRCKKFSVFLHMCLNTIGIFEVFNVS